jgi:hypothetical protein
VTITVDTMVAIITEGLAAALSKLASTAEPASKGDS